MLLSQQLPLLSFVLLPSKVYKALSWAKMYSSVTLVKESVLLWVEDHESFQAVQINYSQIFVSGGS